jgi:hypothetical protein
MNDRLEQKLGDNDVTDNHGISHEGASMEKTVLETVNHTESEEVSGKRTRSEYNGSKAHGITADLEHIKTITAYINAVDRLRQRRAFLISEYNQIATDYEATRDVSERAKLLKSKASKEAQIKAVMKTSKSLSLIESEIEEAEREAQAAVEFIDYDAA